MRPVMRDDTVAKKNPNRTMRTDTRMLPWVGSPGITARKIASASEPPSTIVMGMSRSVRSWLPPPPAPNPFQPFTRGGNDCRQRAAERDEAGREHRAGADVADVGAPDLPGRHLRNQEGQTGGGIIGKRRMNRRERRGDRRAKQREQRQQHQPRQHAASHHRPGDARADHVTDAHVFRREVDAERGVWKLAGSRRHCSQLR